MKFQSICYALGERSNNADDLSATIDISIINKIEEKSGIINRRICADHESAVTLAKKLFDDVSNKESIKQADLIIVVSESKEAAIPPISSHILADFGLLEGKIVLDLDSGCAGYVQALQMTDAFFKNPLIKKAVIITTDAYSKFINLNDRSVAPIFGDGASITVMINDGFESIKASNNGTDPSKYKHLEIQSDNNYSLKMAGAEIFMFVKAFIPQSIRSCLKEGENSIQEIDYFFLHQASSLVIEVLRKDLQISNEITPFCIASTGNLVSTSIPFMLSDYLDKIKGKRIVLSGFGVGLTWATVLMELA